MDFSTLHEQWVRSGILSLDMRYRDLWNRGNLFFQDIESGSPE